MSELILDRFEKLKIIRSTPTKVVQSIINRNTGERAVAKIQQSNIMKDSKVRNVLHEASFTQTLQGYRGIPFMHWSGKTKDDKIILIVQQLGDTLQSRFKLCTKFSAKTTCMLGIQMLEIVKIVHDKGFVISNVGLELFQFGKGDKCLDIFINNLSQCMVYRDFNTMAHILQPKKYLRNPANIFQSGAVYRNQEKSRRDDIQSLFLILIYLLKGDLPWSQNFIKANEKQYKLKVSTQIFMYEFSDTKKICEGLPKVFNDLLEDCRALEFEQQPPYHWYILKLKSVLYTNSQEHDYVYDWVTLPQYNKSLQMPMESPCIKLEKDEELMNYLQEFIFPNIDLDELTEKYEQVLEAKKQRYLSPKKGVQDLQNTPTKQNQSNSNFNYLDRIEQQKQSRISSSKKGASKLSSIKIQNQNQNALNTSIMKRKKQKQEQCCIM